MTLPALQRLRRFSVAPLLWLGLAWLVSHTDPIRRQEWRSLDWRTSVRARVQAPPDSRISIVLFEDETEMNLVPWPPDRAVHADFIKLLTLAAPKVVTWDVILDSTRDGDGDAEMARAAGIAARAGVSVITGAVTNPDPVPDAEESPGPTRPLTKIEGDIRAVKAADKFAVLPFPELRAASWYGFVDAPAEVDGIIREVPLVARVGDRLYPSLSLQTLMAFYDVPTDAVRVRLGDAVYLPTETQGEVRIPVGADGRCLVNYRYDQNENGLDFTAINYLGALVTLNDKFVEKKTDAVPPPDFRGGIVFIGQTVTGKADSGPTPRSGKAPLVLMHANLVNNVLAGDFARPVPAWIVWVGAVIVGYAGMLLGRRRPVWVLATLAVLTGVLYTSVALAAWIKFSLWLPLVAPMLGFVGLQFHVIARRVVEEQRAREQVKQMFGTYLSPELLKKMMKEGQNVAAVSSERRPVTILFSDLRDFTSLTESLEDSALIAQLNEYLAAMVECIHREGGTLHKFIGDAVMAVWGDLASEGSTADARKAARAALAMQAALDELNRAWAARGMPALRMGIGLNHGVVLIGNIGSPRRMEFTAIGDAVNLASRLESLNKELKTSVLVGESLVTFLGEVFTLRPCGSVPVKGKARPVEVYELVADGRAGASVAN